MDYSIEVFPIHMPGTSDISHTTYMSVDELPPGILAESGDSKSIDIQPQEEQPCHYHQLPVGASNRRTIKEADTTPSPGACAWKEELDEEATYCYVHPV